MSGPRFSVMPGWVFTDSRFKSMDIRVLGMLGRHIDKAGWCTRSQVKLAKEMNVARSTVQASLTRMCAIGVVQKRENKTADGRDCSHDWRVIFDNEAAEIDGENGDIPPADISAPPATISAPPAASGSAPYKNAPLKTNLREGAQARANGIEEKKSDPSGDDADGHPLADEKKALKALNTVHTKWPTYAADSIESTKDAFLELSPEDRQAGLDQAPIYVEHLTKTLGRSKVCAMSTYLKQRRWLQLPAEAVSVAEKSVAAKQANPNMAAPLGPVWMARRMVHLLRGQENEFAEPLGEVQTRFAIKAAWPHLMALDDQSNFRRDVIIGAQFHALKDAMEWVSTDSALFEQWRQYHFDNAWLWLRKADAMSGAYFPKGGPQALAAFEQAVSEALERDCASAAASGNERATASDNQTWDGGDDA